jgi:hypothetical protein
MTESLELRPCRAPNCHYKAPTCEWGYCEKCCTARHGPALTGSFAHKRPASVSVGFQIIDNSRHRSIETTEITEAPKLGDLSPCDDIEFPVEVTTNRYWQGL